MRKTTKSPGEKIVKDIKRATIARQGIAQQYPERGASITHPKRRLGSCWTASVAKTASLSCVAVKESRRASITNGRSTARQCMFSCTRGDFMEAGKRRLAGVIRPSVARPDGLVLLKDYILRAIDILREDIILR
jgi:hypothetical protein